MGVKQHFMAASKRPIHLHSPCLSLSFCARLFFSQVKATTERNVHNTTERWKDKLLKEMVLVVWMVAVVHNTREHERAADWLANRSNQFYTIMPVILSYT